MLRSIVYRQVTYDLHVTVIGRRKLEWRYELPWTVSASGVSASVALALWNGQRAAETAIDEELDG